MCTTIRFLFYVFLLYLYIRNYKNNSLQTPEILLIIDASDIWMQDIIVYYGGNGTIYILK